MRSEHRRRAGRALAFPLALMIALTGCGLTIPTDPQGTLDRIRDSGLVRAGASISPGLVEEDPDGTLHGGEVDLVEAFAEQQGAGVEWTVGSEQNLVDGLEAGDLDLVVGGMTDDTPWTDRAGVTRGFTGIDGSDGRALVVLVPLGENRLLSALEEFLDAEAGS